MPSSTERTDQGEEPESELAEGEVGEGREASDDAEVGEETTEQRMARESAEYLANWKRARADYQNLRRRQREDIDLAIGRAQAKIIEN